MREDMTVGEYIRDSNDLVLAKFICDLLMKHREEIMKLLHEKGLIQNIETVTIPELAIAAILKILKSPIKGDML